MSDMIEAIEAARKLVLDLGPQPVRVEVTSANFARLREWSDFETWERELHSLGTYVPPEPRLGWALTGVPVVVNDDLPAPGYQIIYSEESA